MTKHLSHSQCEMWEQCPRKWQLVKVDRMAEAPSTALILGTAVHEAIEEDARRRSRGVRHECGQTLLMAIAAFSRSLSREVARRDPTGLLRGEVPLLRRRGLAILRAYADHVAPRLFPLPDAVEEAFNFPIAADAADGWTFTGRVDARTCAPAATAPSICDFKTGKAWAQGAEHTKPQATAYLWAEAQRADDGGQRADKVAFITLPDTVGEDGRVSASAEIRLTRRTPQQIAAYATYARGVAGAIDAATATGVFPARTGPLCGWCGVLGACAVGRAWLRANGRASHVPGVTVEGAAEQPEQVA